MRLPLQAAILVSNVTNKVWGWVSNLLRGRGRFRRRLFFLSYHPPPPPTFDLHLKPRWPPVAVRSEVTVNCLSLRKNCARERDTRVSLSLSRASFFSAPITSKRLLRKLSLWLPGCTDVKFCKSPSCDIFYGFFFHVFRLCMTFFSFIYLYLKLWKPG